MPTALELSRDEWDRYVQDEKFKALERFARRLLSGPAGNNVTKIILFGSLTKGAARPDSDIDVLVFTFNQKG